MGRAALHLAVAVACRLRDLSRLLQLLEVMQLLLVGTPDAAQHACLLEGGSLWPWHWQDGTQIQYSWRECPWQ